MCVCVCVCMCVIDVSCLVLGSIWRTLCLNLWPMRDSITGGSTGNRYTHTSLTHYHSLQHTHIYIIN